VSGKGLRHLKQPIGGYRGRCPIEDIAIHFPACDVPIPVRTRLRSNHNHIGYITWTETPADCQLEPLEQTSTAPLSLEPFRRYFRPAAIDRTTATAPAYQNLTDNIRLVDRSILLYWSIVYDGPH
jgi:hypothetical protein